MQQPRDFSLYGAVDLGARQAAAQRSQQAASRASGPDGPQGGNVIDVTEETFNAEVVERSRTTPVIIDLWADWCGPCKQLSPVLEKLAVEADGAWVLAKVDIDANPQLRAALQVQSIPMVMAVVGGQVVDGFLGAMPEAQVRQWLGQLMQVASQLGLPGAAGGQDGSRAGRRRGARGRAARGGPGQPGMGMRGGPGADMLADPAFDEAQQAMERGDLDGAAAAFQRVLRGLPGHPVASLGLAQVGLIQRVNSYDEAQVRRDAAENPDDVDAQSRVADLELAIGRIEEAFDRLLGTVRRTVRGGPGSRPAAPDRPVRGLPAEGPAGDQGPVHAVQPAVLTAHLPQRRTVAGPRAPVIPRRCWPRRCRGRPARPVPQDSSAGPHIARPGLGDLLQRGQRRGQRGQLVRAEPAQAVREQDRALLPDPLEHGVPRRGDRERAGPGVTRDRARCT